MTTIKKSGIIQMNSKKKKRYKRIENEKKSRRHVLKVHLDHSLSSNPLQVLIHDLKAWIERPTTTGHNRATATNKLSIGGPRTTCE